MSTPQCPRPAARSTPLATPSRIHVLPRLDAVAAQRRPQHGDGPEPRGREGDPLTRRFHATWQRAAALACAHVHMSHPRGADGLCGGGHGVGAARGFVGVRATLHLRMSHLFLPTVPHAHRRAGCGLLRRACPRPSSASPTGTHVGRGSGGRPQVEPGDATSGCASCQAPIAGARDGTTALESSHVVADSTPSKAERGKHAFEFYGTSSEVLSKHRLD
jgi:hypothetical protein